MCFNGGSNPAKPSACGGSTPCPPPTPSPFSGGKSVYKDSAVEVKTGVKYDGTSYDDGLTITVKCAKNPRTVQFIYREIIGADGKPKKKKMKTTGGEYETTVDPANPVWNTDSAAKPDPAYEAGGAHHKQPGELTIFDQPAVESPSGPLKLAPGEESRATFKTFVICDGKVIREITWVRSAKQGEAPKYTVKAAEAKELPKWANDQLKKNGYNPAP